MSDFFKNDFLSIYAQNSLAHIEFHAEKTKNAISFSTAAHLTDCVGKHGATPAFLYWLMDNKCGALLFHSQLEGIFVSGGDVKELSESQAHNASTYANNMREFCMGLAKLEVPSVTLLAGGAFGGGAELALATDFRFVTHTAALHFWQSQWGVPGGWNGMARLSELTHYSPRQVGLLFATAASFDAEKMMRLNIADALFVTSTDAYNAAGNLASRFLACDKTLRNLLLKRNMSHAPLHESDATLFANFWMGPIHLAKLAEYKNRRAKK